MAGRVRKQQASLLRGCGFPIERSGPPLDPALAVVLATVDAGEASCDGVAAGLGLPGPDAAAALARLEVLGYVSCSPMGVYSRTLLAPPSSAAAI